MKNEHDFIKYYGIEAAQEVLEKDGKYHDIVLNCASGSYGFKIDDLRKAVENMEVK